MVDEHAGELVADGAVDERGGHGGIHAAGQAQNHFVAADLFADFGHGFVDVVRHGPARLCAADVEHEAVDEGAALFGVGDFGVELDAVEVFICVFHHGDGAGGRAADGAEVFRQPAHFVAVAHPHVQGVRCAVVNAAGERAVLRLHLRVTKFALVAGLHFAAQMVRHKLHAVADAEHGHAQVEQPRVGLVFAVVHGIGAAGKDDAFRVEGFDVGQRHIVGVQLAIHMGFAHTAGDELGDLRTEVEDEDFVGGHVGTFTK